MHQAAEMGSLLAAPESINEEKKKKSVIFDEFSSVTKKNKENVTERKRWMDVVRLKDGFADVRRQQTTFDFSVYTAGHPLTSRGKQ